MGTSGFELRGWERSGQHENERTKVLGLVWNKKNDTLEINMTSLKQELPAKITKRVILSIAQALFDPIGFTAPVTLFPKVLLQEAWASKIDWETAVNDDLTTRFVAWFEELQMLGEMKISRHLFDGTEKPENMSLHVFCDASQKAYAAVVYIRSETVEGVTLRLVQAKSRVAPKKTTIPLLELLAATIGARLMASTINALELTGILTSFWSDSTTILSWIRRESEWSVFVWNRVQEIKKLTDWKEWRHVPGEINPADLLSRGCSVEALIASKWWEGPEWLLNPARDWPRQSFTADETEVRTELKKTATIMMVNDSREIPSNDWIYQHRSGYRETIRLQAYVRRFVNNSRRSREERKIGNLSVAEIEEAEMQVLESVQEESFKGEYDERFGSLSAFKDEDGLIRLNTKIARRSDAYSFRFPVVLPSRHPITRQLVFKKHVELCHAGVQTVLVNLREDF
ncbi:uncharacterized protein LOC124404697 [Diprion similis]|uniref:uncharacterized protein LOC124404697 n=1 Tax=Diprion similis TaxID=362088 RepID=UPI001EF75890|nr:uncharacterized protein LOC124404697 [Diprion similis]